MPFKLVIRHNIEQTADDFGNGDVREFAGKSVTVGSGGDCDCAVGALPEVADFHFTIHELSGHGDFALHPEPGQTLFLNNEPVLAVETVLTSGDEIRLGHYTLRFQNMHRAAGMARRADLLAIFAKILVAFILATELLVVYWLPRKFQNERILARQIQKQETIMLLDVLRRRAGKNSPDQQLNSQARLVILEELNSIAEFIRDNENQLSPQQWLRFNEYLLFSQMTLTRLESGGAFPELPSPALEAGAKAIIQPDGK